MWKVQIEEESLSIIRGLKVNFNLTMTVQGDSIVVEIRSKADNSYVGVYFLFNKNNVFAFYNHCKQTLRGLKARCNRAEEALSILESL